MLEKGPGWILLCFTVLFCQTHQYVIAFETNGMAGCRFGGWHRYCASVAYIELCPMPGAGQAVAFELSIAQRAAVVCTNIIQAEVLVIDADDDQITIIQFDAQFSRGRHVG